ncbi:methylated-DNA--[protein]-cysteine S-methyltransferase [Paenibacillus sp. Marseille-Q4541]|uniref:methylated-DNA--[protein]-cysteine S-methyltransferase n=1 Tax=Paenibacillus sp. Marseille-Q4541 TaxID=2831522 RepID=UPI001BA7CF16|nr:methylated-DNA--[protein]-cysteine S-methyltransferase [Paenibacillus sp. Marseille-Q4541]
MTLVYWTKVQHALLQNQSIYVAATEQGVCRITWPSESWETLVSWVHRHIPDATLVESEQQLAPYLKQLTEYLDGERSQFSLPIDLRGTPFQMEIWKALQQIPYGETRSYSDIAAHVGRAAAVRAVGTANGANPVPMLVPCHRVIGKNKNLTGFRGGLHFKEALLTLEGYHEYNRKGHARFEF